MPRKKENFRDALQRVDEAFPNRELLTIKQASDYLGVCERSVKKYLPVTPLGVSKVKIAQFLVQN